ncbi:hypothetical protein GGI08_000987 [Coemansia sp. S2]|nr:hypothetical protein GGI08_000987 [Coemansia sp. S2]KAJ2431170.1 hypothetical protein GGF41_000670 [Coemansia sp. RSA 2531]
MADVLTVSEKSGEYIKTYYIQSKIDKVEDFTKVLKEKLPTLVEGHTFELLNDSFEQDCFQYLGERVYKLSGLGQNEGEKGGWRCFLQITLY